MTEADLANIEAIATTCTVIGKGDALRLVEEVRRLRRFLGVIRVLSTDPRAQAEAAAALNPPALDA